MTPDADQTEGEEGPDIRQVGERTDIGQHRHAADDDAGPDGGDVRRAKTRMDPGKILREQSIARHGHENARLAELENEQAPKSGRRARPH